MLQCAFFFFFKKQHWPRIEEPEMERSKRKNKVKQEKYIFLKNVRPLRPSYKKAMLVVNLGDSCQIIWHCTWCDGDGWKDSNIKNVQSYCYSQMVTHEKLFYRNYLHNFKVTCHFWLIGFLYIAWAKLGVEYLKNNDDHHHRMKKKKE